MGHRNGPGDTRIVNFKKHANAADSSHAVISKNGRYVAFIAERAELAGFPGNSYEQVVRFDRTTGVHKLVSVNGSGQPVQAHCQDLAISDDGRFVVFDTESAELQRADSKLAVYRHDCNAGTT